MYMYMHMHLFMYMYMHMCVYVFVFVYEYTYMYMQEQHTVRRSSTKPMCESEQVSLDLFHLLPRSVAVSSASVIRPITRTCDVTSLLRSFDRFLRGADLSAPRRQRKQRKITNRVGGWEK